MKLGKKKVDVGYLPVDPRAVFAACYLAGAIVSAMYLYFNRNSVSPPAETEQVIHGKTIDHKFDKP